MAAVELSHVVHGTITEGSRLYNDGRCQECAGIYFDCAQRCISSVVVPPDCKTILRQAVKLATAQFKELGRAEQSAWELRRALDYTLGVLAPLAEARNPFFDGVAGSGTVISLPQVENG